MEVIDSKNSFNEFKFFKKIYTKIKSAERVLFTSRDNTLFLLFPKNSFYLLYGEVLFESKFVEWFKNKNINFTVNLDDIALLKSCLKKNVISVSYNDDEFIFEFTDSEGNNKKIAFRNQENIPKDFDVELISEIEKKLVYKFEIDETYFSDELFKVFLEEENLSLNRTENKVLEIPTARILSYQKTNNNELQFSERNNDTRYVALSSSGDELKLKQIFLTI